VTARRALGQRDRIFVTLNSLDGMVNAETGGRQKWHWHHARPSSWFLTAGRDDKLRKLVAIRLLS
jgi:hypothetical protein